MNIKPKLLLVDDEPEILELLNLTFRDFESETALNTESTLELLRTRHFDVLITDIKMPGESGLRLIDCAKKISPDLVVIVITGHHQEVPAAAKDKVSHWILKPFSIYAIREAVFSSIQKL
jgi:two-component system response regulator YesN